MTDELDMTKPLDRLIFNYAHARRSWESWCFLVDHDVKIERPEILEYVNDDNLLSHLRYLALKDFHIEITKIIKESKNNSDNIFKFLKELTVDTNPKSSEAKECLEQLNLCTSIIKSIVDWRDKYYAHLDPNFEQHIKSIPLVDINKCFIAIENSIMALTSRDTLLSQLDKIPSRDEFQLKIN